MKKMLRIAAALAALLAMTNFIGCKNDDDDDGDVAVTDVKITSTVKEVTAGETITLTAEVLPADATNKTVTWTSSDTTVATVKDGVVTGVKAGTAKITAKAGEKTDAVDVTVKAAATSGGETGGSGSGETGGSTGGTTGGSTGGETGTTTGFENTYWVLEEEVSDVSGIKITLKNIVYTYIKDSTNGTIYFADIDSAMEELIKTNGGTRTVTYEGATGDEFKYTVDGKNITLTATAEGKTPLTGTIVDENTLKFTDNSDGEPIEYTLKKATAAPTQATVTVEVTAAPSTGVNAAWDFSTSPENFPTSDAAADAITDLPVAANSGSGATLTATGRWKFNSGLQAQATSGVTVADIASEAWIGKSDKAKYLTLTLDSSAKVTVVFCGAGGEDAKRFVGLLSNSNEVLWSEGSLSGTEVTKTEELAAGTYKIAANGSRIKSVTCE